MFETMAGGENPGPGRPKKNWTQCLVDDLRVFRATEGSTESFASLFGINTVLWFSAAEKSGKWYRVVVEAAEYFMARWNRDEAESSWLRHAAEDAKSNVKEKAGGGGGGRTDTAVDECKNEIHLVSRYRFDKEVECVLIQPPNRSSFVCFLLICSPGGRDSGI